MTQTRTSAHRPIVVSLMVGLSALSALGAAAMSVAHAGVDVPVLSALGPQGGAVPPAAAAFAVGAVGFALVALGIMRRQPWAWAAAVALNAIALAAAAIPYRGFGSLVGIVVTCTALAVLIAPAGRRALLYPR